MENFFKFNIKKPDIHEEVEKTFSRLKDYGEKIEKREHYTDRLNLQKNNLPSLDETEGNFEDDEWPEAEEVEEETIDE